MARSANQSPSHTAQSTLSAIVESTQDSVIGLTPQGIITSWNPAAARLYGYRARELVGKSVEILYAARRDDRETDFLRRIASGERVSRQHVGRRRKDGSAISVWITGAPVFDAAGTVVGATTISSGDPRWQPSRWPEQPPSRQAQRLEILGQLASGIAHDFNNLLTVILNDVAIVREDLARSTESDWPDRLRSAESDLSQIARASRWAAALTRQLVEFARQDDRIRPRAVDLNAVVIAVADLLRRTLGEHIEVVTSLDDHLWPVLADPGQLEQLLVNLVVNARDAMPAGGTVTIDTANSTVAADAIAGGSGPPGRSVRLRVSDTGVGMPPEIAEHVFEPFFTTKKEGSGTGLGLASARGILARNDGHVHVYSEPGLGSTFTVTLPATAVASAPRALPVPAGRRPKDGRTGGIILVVEDDDAVLQVIRRILTHGGFQVITAADGQEAIQIARERRTNLQLLMVDAVLPNLPGKDVAEKIRAIRPTARALFVSGYARPLLTSQGLLEPGLPLLEKPFSATDLLNKVDQELNGRAAGEFGGSEYPAPHLDLAQCRNRTSAA
jgi:PAS domain S-box-containing protein